MNPKEMRAALVDMEAQLRRYASAVEKEIYQGQRHDRVDAVWRAKAHERLEQAHRAIQTAISGLAVAYEIHDLPPHDQGAKP